jgi:hypothetical protein
MWNWGGALLLVGCLWRVPCPKLALALGDEEAGDLFGPKQDLAEMVAQSAQESVLLDFRLLEQARARVRQRRRRRHSEARSFQGLVPDLRYEAIKSESRQMERG